MGIELRLPQIQGSEKEQLVQIRSYLYQLTEQLQWALNNIDTVGGSGSGGYGGSGNLPYQQTNSINISNSVSAMNPEITFAKIKDLIIKSADIVDAYYEEINRKLVGLYVAQSDFGKYAEKTEQEIEENSLGITRTFENTQIIIQNTVDAASREASNQIREAKGELSDEINGAKDAFNGKIRDANARIDETNSAVENLGVGLNGANQRLDSAEGALQHAKDELNDAIQTVTNNLSDTDKLLENAKKQLNESIDALKIIVDGLTDSVIGVKAYVQTGLLYYTDAGIPVYGVEIGQEVEANGEKVFNKFSRFTSEKLSFYDTNGYEVAYVSDKKLYIGQAEITTSLQVGGLVDLVMTNGDVVTKWVGKE